MRSQLLKAKMATLSSLFCLIKSKTSELLSLLYFKPRDISKSSIFKMLEQ